MVCVFPQNSRLDILERDLAVTGKAFEVQTYQGIFVKKKVLFEGEIMEYRISELEDGKWVLKKEGSVSCDAASADGDSESRFACLNEMSLCLSLKDEEGLKKRMREYLTKNAAAEELFPLM